MRSVVGWQAPRRLVIRRIARCGVWLALSRQVICTAIRRDGAQCHMGLALDPWHDPCIHLRAVKSTFVSAVPCSRGLGTVMYHDQEERKPRKSAHRCRERP